MVEFAGHDMHIKYEILIFFSQNQSNESTITCKKYHIESNMSKNGEACWRKMA